MRGSALLAGVGLAAFCANAMAQSQSNNIDLDRFERQLEQIQRETREKIDTSIGLDQRAVFDMGGFLSFNFLTLHDPQHKTHTLRQTELLGYSKLNIDGAHEFFVRGTVRYNDFHEGDSFNNKGDYWQGPELERATYHFDLRRYLSAYEDTKIESNVEFTGGRQLIHWANGLVLSQVIDGGDLVLSKGPLKLDVIAGLTPNLYSDIDASRPNFENRTNRAFYGAMFSVEVEKHRPYVYGLVQEDLNHHGPYSLNFGGTAVPDARYDYNSWYLGAGSEGSIGDQLVYGVEVVYEGGSTQSDIGLDSTSTPLSQTSDKISAGALDVRLDYLFTDENRSRLSSEFILATGDSDRTTSTTNTIGGNRANTNDHAFNAFGLVNTGLAFAPSVSNIMVLRLGASTYPAPGIRFFNRLQTGADLLIYNKLDSAGPIGEATGSQGFLGVEPDLYVNWQLASDLTLAVRYGVFLPGNTIESSHAARHFLFTGLTLGF